MKRYQFGNVINTEAVVVEVPCDELKDERFSVDEADKRVSLDLQKKDLVYGLGVTPRGMNKRGWIYESNCSDDPNHSEDKHSLYSAHNFLMIQGEKSSLALFIDTPGKVTFDVGYTENDKLVISFEDFSFDLYTFEDSNPTEVIKEFRSLIGESYMPPLFAFGLGQSRWSYKTADEVRKLVEDYEKAGIPLDSVYLDIDYLDDYKDFTVSEERFPNFKDFVKEMKEKHIHLVPIIDAGVKQAEGYGVCQEGLDKGYFCKKADGKELVAAVWPGKSYFPDFLRPEVREWFGNKYKVLTDVGIDGFWNDMNEPAIFYTEDHLSEVFEKIEDYKGKNLDINGFFEFKDLVGGLDNNPEDYARFYHDYHGERINHSKVHNLYGFNMTRAAGEALKKIAPDKDMLLFSRSSYIGMHRYGGIWTGDNKSWWSHLLMNIQQMPSLSMCGFLYSGADTGGFGCDCTRDLMLRWTAFSIFTPLFRNHAAMGTRRQEYTAFGDTEDFKNIIGLRYALLPYIYRSFVNAVKENRMYMSPLSFAFPNDDRARKIEDQLLVGDSLMIAPVYKQNAEGRYVYLPEDMTMYRLRSVTDYDRTELKAGDHYIDVALNEVLVFVRKGKEIPFGEAAKNVDEVNFNEIQTILK